MGETRRVFDITHITSKELIFVEKYFDYLNTRNRNMTSNVDSFIEYEIGEDFNIELGFTRK